MGRNVAKDSKISWTHHTFNPWRGCTKVSDGCKHCYAETMSKRNPAVLGLWGPQGVRAPAAESYWKQPERWNHEAQASGERRRVFCASLADAFEGPETMPVESWPVVEAARTRLFALVERTRWLDWLLLTKRPENMPRFAPLSWARGWPDNVWAMTSVENQKEADRRIPLLLQVPAKVRGLSCEPLLGDVDLTHWLKYGEFSPYGRRAIHWVIVGGESGADARPMFAAWARSLRDQCIDAGVAFHFKQHGEYLDGVRVGKRLAGRLLDDKEWNEVPNGV